jgi:hypothetical protein
MSAQACRAAFEGAPPRDRAGALDTAFPSCSCEPWALTAVGGGGVHDDELLARILTSPNGYNLTSSTVIRERLQVIYSSGLSIIRAGASDQEILDTISELTSGDDPKTLVGAVLLTARTVRSYIHDDYSQWFGVYATDAGEKVRHADILGTTPNAGSKNARRRMQDDRRYKLADDMNSMILFETDPASLVVKLRQAGC